MITKFEHMDSINHFLTEFMLFLHKKERNIWIYTDCFHIYIRKSKRHYDGKLIDCIDIASIEVDEEYKGQKILTTLLETLFQKYPKFNYLVESILEPRLIGFLQKYGFVKYPEHDEDINNMIKINNI